MVKEGDFMHKSSDYGKNKLIFGFNTNPFGFSEDQMETLFNSTTDGNHPYGNMVAP
jgi:hypothetical protein